VLIYDPSVADTSTPIRAAVLSCANQRDLSLFTSRVRAGRLFRHQPTKLMPPSADAKRGSAPGSGTTAG
jgi:hypothetical protein